MIFTDSDIVTADALTRLDSEVAAVAKATRPAIVVEGGGSICEQAWAECGRKILGAMQSYVSYPAQTGMPATHIAAVTNVGVPARTQARIRLNQIVASDTQYAGMQSQVELWMVYHALYLLYRDASSRVDNDRYQEKMERYQRASLDAWRGLKTEGLPMLYQPLEAPGAKHGFSAGTWSASSVAGVATGNQTVRVALTYCDATRGYVSQSSKGNAESGPSAIATVVVAADNVLQVDISGLNPPSGVSDPTGLAQGAWTPLTATHWNLWAGAADGPLYLQEELIPIATKTFTLPGDPVLSGSIVGNGQYADLNLVFLNMVMRG